MAPSTQRSWLRVQPSMQRMRAADGPQATEVKAASSDSKRRRGELATHELYCARLRSGQTLFTPAVLVPLELLLYEVNGHERGGADAIITQLGPLLSDVRARLRRTHAATPPSRERVGLLDSFARISRRTRSHSTTATARTSPPRVPPNCAASDRAARPYPSRGMAPAKPRWSRAHSRRTGACICSQCRVRTERCS